MDSSLLNINRFVVLMLENRSFDHLLGYLKKGNPSVEGLTGADFSNLPNPNNSNGTAVPTSPNAPLQMPFDPGHEFCDVQTQLYGPNPALKCTDPLGPCGANPAQSPAPMNGFLSSGIAAAQAQKAGTGSEVMQCFDYGNVPYITALAEQFALFNFWYSSLPGPTWPNRFFIHAGTSGGLTDSPSTEQIVLGFSFKANTIYHALSAAGKDWRIYHDGMPQTAGIDSLRLAYIDPFTRHFREWAYFAQDVANGILPEYTFIEPRYDSGHNYVSGTSMHPLNSIAAGDALVKSVYETLRASPTYWRDTMLIITFDEHGGFYDHVPPAPAIPTGDDSSYANPNHKFGFDVYGIRVPAIVISAYTQQGTVVGQSSDDGGNWYDHSSVLATVQKKFGLSPLTNRDRNANTLDVALNLSQPRTDAPLTLEPPN